MVAGRYSKKTLLKHSVGKGKQKPGLTEAALSGSIRCCRPLNQSVLESALCYFMMNADGVVEGGVREWWHENSLNSRRGFGVEDLDSSKHAKARRRGDGSGSAYFENIVLPLRPSELGGSSRGSSSDRSVDNLFDQDMGAGSNHTLASGGSLWMNMADADEPEGHRRKQRLSFLFPWLAAGGLRRKLPTLFFLLILVAGAFLLGRVSSISGGSSSETPPPPPPPPSSSSSSSSLSSPEFAFSASERTGARGSAVDMARTGTDNQEQAEESSFIPKCGTEYAIPGGSGYGGHNEALGCLNAGKMTWPSCVHLLATNRAKYKHKKVGRKGVNGLHCTAATWKGQECWLHDRRMNDWWSEQNGEIGDYAPDSEDSAGEALLASGPNKGSALLQAAKGEPILIIRLEHGLDNCRL